MTLQQEHRTTQAVEWDRFLRHAARVKRFEIGDGYSHFIEDLQLICDYLPHLQSIFPNLLSIKIGSQPDTQDPEVILVYLPLLPGTRLEAVDIQGCGFQCSWAVLGHLVRDRPNIRSLDVQSFPGNQSDVLIHFQALEELRIHTRELYSSTTFNLDSFAYLPNLRVLSFASLSRDGLTGCLASHAPSFTALEVLHLGNVSWIGSIVPFLRAISSTRLTDFDIYFMTYRADSVDPADIDKALDAISRFSSLRKLSFTTSGSGFTDGTTISYHPLLRLNALEEVCLGIYSFSLDSQSILDFGRAWNNVRILKMHDYDLEDDDASAPQPPIFKLEVLDYLAIHLPRLEHFEASIDARNPPHASPRTHSLGTVILDFCDRIWICEETWQEVAAYIFEVFPNAVLGECFYHQGQEDDELSSTQLLWRRICRAAVCFRSPIREAPGRVATGHY